jgi:hypothetical protein
MLMNATLQMHKISVCLPVFTLWFITLLQSFNITSYVTGSFPISRSSELYKVNKKSYYHFILLVIRACQVGALGINFHMCLNLIYFNFRQHGCVECLWLNYSIFILNLFKQALSAVGSFHSDFQVFWPEHHWRNLSNRNA